MQRGFINKVYIKYFWLSLFFLYSALSVMYLYFPPLLGIVSLYFYHTLDEDDRYFFYALVVGLTFFEANRGFLLFSTSLFLYLSYFYIIPKMRNITTCKKCLYPIFITLSYFGYYVFMFVIDFVFNFDYLNFDYIVIYYIFVEILIALVWI